MALTVEAALTVPLALTLLLVPVVKGPPLTERVVDTIAAAERGALITASPEHIYRVTSVSELPALEASPQMTLELVSLTSDMWSIFDLSAS